MWEDLQITNRLLYQLSYVGLSSILNGRLESVKQQGQAPSSMIRQRAFGATSLTPGLLP
jgi:hypothetical protein